MPASARIEAVATAVPPRRFTQDEVLALAGPRYSHPAIRQIFLNSDIEHRHLWLDPETFSPEEDLDQLHRRYKEGAVALARAAAVRCLERAGRTAADVDCILVASCTGYLCPDLATILVKEMGLPGRVQRGALLGHGCAGALPLLQRASDFARANPGRRALAVAVEICSTCYYLDDSLETVIGNAICADGAAACLVSTAAPGPAIAGFASLIDPNCQSSVGFAHRQGRLRIILAPTIRDLAPPMVERTLEQLLVPRSLTRDDVRFWVLHPGGRKIIERLQETLGFTDEQVALSRGVLRHFGNMSSPTVLFVLEALLEQGAAQPGDRGVLLALGPGFAGEAALLEW